MNSTYYNIPMSRPIENFMYKVYGWMFAGLALTAATAYSLFEFFPHVMIQIACSPLIYVLFLAQIVLVIGLSAAINRLSYTTAAFMFLVYSALMGITLAPIFLIYTMGSIYTTFLVASGMFGAMAIYGYFTESDLTTMGNIALMGLFGLILASFINWFVGSSHMEYLLAFGGVIIFTLLTAYDVQKIKQFSMYGLAHEESESKIAVYGALTLYLDFLNLFLNLLRLMGKRKD